jgi:hypothetical protein
VIVLAEREQIKNFAKTPKVMKGVVGTLKGCCSEVR